MMMAWLAKLIAVFSKPKPVPLPPQPRPRPVMLILRGIKGHFDDKDWPRGALYEQPALEYARLRGYVGRVLDVSGEAYPNSPQMIAALTAFRSNQAIAAFYGFSGGGYNLAHILDTLSDDEAERVKLVVVLGAQNNHPDKYRGNWELVYRNDPVDGHMAGPQALIDQFKQSHLAV